LVKKNFRRYRWTSSVSRAWPCSLDWSRSVNVDARYQGRVRLFCCRPYFTASDII